MATNDIILIIISVLSSYYYNEVYNDMVIYDVSPSESIYIHESHKYNLNSYFCPSYCDVNHSHYAHSTTHICSLNDEVCNHFTYDIKYLSPYNFRK